VKNYPEEHRGHDSVTVSPLWRSPFGANQFLSMLLPMLMTIAGLVLLLACANVANLMLVRSVARRREIAIRMSLGASRWRLVRQLLVESLLLALAGGVIALFITFWTAGTFMKFVPATDFPISLVVRADRAVLLATFVISLLTGVIFGILPALRCWSEAPVAVLKEDTGNLAGGLRKARLTSGLVVAQILATLTSRASMLPPNSAGTIELRASPSPGASPTQPMNGCSGIFAVKFESAALKVAVLVAWSIG